MTKSKTNALESLRGLIAERQQYEQWITTLESKREGTPPHVFERVQGDYEARLERVVDDIKGHAEELQLSISALSSRLVEVARDEDTKRDALQEAELRATVGEYEPERWEQLKAEAEQALEKIAADRAGLDGQLGELRSIQKLSEVGSTGNVGEVGSGDPASASDTSLSSTDSASHESPELSAFETPSTADEELHYSQQDAGNSGRADGEPSRPFSEQSQSFASEARESAGSAPSDQGNFPLESAAAASAAVLSSPPQVPTAQPAAAQSSPPGNDSSSYNPAGTSTPRPRSGKTPPFGGVAANPKPSESRAGQSKTLKCPECGTANYPTEWYCERCAGELATM